MLENSELRLLVKLLQSVLWISEICASFLCMCFDCMCAVHACMYIRVRTVFLHMVLHSAFEWMGHKHMHREHNARCGWNHLVLIVSTSVKIDEALWSTAVATHRNM
jgi:hypothetical protein